MGGANCVRTGTAYRCAVTTDGAQGMVAGMVRVRVQFRRGLWVYVDAHPPGVGSDPNGLDLDPNGLDLDPNGIDSDPPYITLTPTLQPPCGAVAVYGLDPASGPLSTRPIRVPF